MPLTPAEFLGVLDDAIAAAPRGRRRIILDLHTRPGGVITVYGEHVATGRYLGSDDRGPVYGFTRRQCEDIRAAIFAVAADDAQGVSDG